MVNQPKSTSVAAARIARCISSRCRIPTPPSYAVGAAVQNKIQQTGFEDVSSDLQLNNPQVTVEMNRDKLSTLA